MDQQNWNVTDREISDSASCVFYKPHHVKHFGGYMAGAFVIPNSFLIDIVCYLGIFVWDGNPDIGTGNERAGLVGFVAYHDSRKISGRVGRRVIFFRNAFDYLIISAKIQGIYRIISVRTTYLKTGRFDGSNSPGAECSGFCSSRAGLTQIKQ